MKYLLFLAISVLGVALAAPPRAPARGDKGKIAKAEPGKAGKAQVEKADLGKAVKGKADPAAKGKGSKRKASRNGKNAKLCDYLSPIYEHPIVPGEVVGDIAGRYGVLISDVKRWNPAVKNINRIRDGQKLNICPQLPPRERIREEYTVDKGDSFASIAKRFDLSQDELWAYQQGKLEDRARLQAGKTVLVVWHDGGVVGAFQPESEKGKLSSSARLAPGKAYFIKRPDRVFGTRGTVQRLKQVFDRFAKKNRGFRVVMGDLSAKGGGPLSGHVSHQDGRDVDIGWVFKKGQGNAKTFAHGNKTNLDVPRTWALVHELLKTGKVQFIFIDHHIQELLHEEAQKRKVPVEQLSQWFQYPRPAHRLYGIVRHWKGHSDHMHVRFRKDG